MNRCGWLVLGSMAVLPLASEASAQDVSYPEAKRFDTSEFHEGLKKRGLTDLLALHLVEHPPDDPVDAALLARDIKLAQYADPSRSSAERLAAIGEANRLLQELIAANRSHARLREWQMELGASLLYTEADRYTSSILYRGGSAADRKALGALMDRAVQVIGSLHATLAGEYEALDTLAARKYDQLEASGEIDKLESDLGRSDYMLAWARFYRALACNPSDFQRQREVRLVLEYLEDRSNLLHVPHAETHYQAQALLLAGMSYRLLGDHRACGPLLEQAAEVAANLLDERERLDLLWVVTLARIELTRCYRDAGGFEAAKQTVDILREQARRRVGENSSLPAIVALLERSVYRAEADRAESEGRHDRAAALRARAIRPLRMLAIRDVAYRDDIYATLYEILGPDAELNSLQPFERCALIAGALGEADALQKRIVKLRLEGFESSDSVVVDAQQRRAQMLNRAIEVARPMIASDYAISADLAAQAAFNLGVALHQRGRRLDAAQSFLKVARELPSFFRAQEAAGIAVQLAWDLHQDPSLAARTDIQELYLDAMTTVTDSYPDSRAGRYWQFFLGQHLAGIRRHDAAGEAYAKVQADHERFYEAKYLAAQARMLSLKQLVSAKPANVGETHRRVTDAIRAARNAQRALTDAQASESNSLRKGELLHLAARANLLVGELYGMPEISRWEKALEALDGFETRFKDEPTLMGSVLRVRMVALEGLGRHGKASNLIPQYVATDPGGAAVTLQGLFDTLNEEIERDQSAGRGERARKRAESAFVIAQGLYDLAIDQPGLFGPQTVYALRLQLAQAALEKRDYQRAGALFEECYAEDSGRYSDGQPRDSRAIYGTAEAYFHLGQYARALPLFNKLFRTAQRGRRMRFQALLRDLQCRTELNDDPNVIIKSIRQQKYFDREMGGPELRRGFDALLTLNERRAEGKLSQ